MDRLISESLNEMMVAPVIGLWDLVLALVVSAVLCTLLARVYIFTHSGHSYSRSFVHTQVIVGVTISLIMLIIGSNIARAFALVGALPIIPPHETIIEIKYDERLPNWIGSIVRTLEMQRVSISKYVAAAAYLARDRRRAGGMFP